MRIKGHLWPSLGLLIAVICASLASSAGAITTAPSDVNVLESLNVDAWQQLGGDPCSSNWAGVQCACATSATEVTPSSCTVVERSRSVYAHVVSISLESGALNQGLSGTLPDAISLLSALQLLSLSSQQLRQV